MSILPSPPRKPARPPKTAGKKKNVVTELLEHDLHRRVTYQEYRDTIRDVYDGPQGAFLNAFSVLSLHTPLGDRLLKERKFDLRGAKAPNGKASDCSVTAAPGVARPRSLATWPKRMSRLAARVTPPLADPVVGATPGATGPGAGLDPVAPHVYDGAAGRDS